MTSDREAHEILMRPFRRVDSSGRYYYSDAEVAHFLMYVFLKSSVPLQWLGVVFQRRVVTLLRRLGATGTSGVEMARAVDAHFARVPVNPELAAEFSDAVRSLFGQEGVAEPFGAVEGLLSALLGDPAPEGESAQAVEAVPGSRPAPPQSEP